MAKNVIELFVNAAKQRGVKDCEQAYLSVLPKSVIKKLVDEANKELGTYADGKKIAKLANCFLIGEMNDVVEEFPHMHKRQVIRLFEQQALSKKSARLSSSAISRPYLIDLVEMLEDYTGLKITDDSDAPLEYLDQKCGSLDVEDIGDFFSGREDARIKNIIDVMSGIKAVGPSANNKYQEGESRQTVKAFIASCCGVDESDLNEKAPIKTLKADVDCGARPHYMVVFWAEGRFNKMIPNEFIESKTVGDLIDALAGK